MQPHLLRTEDSVQIKQLIKISWEQHWAGKTKVTRLGQLSSFVLDPGMFSEKTRNEVALGKPARPARAPRQRHTLGSCSVSLTSGAAGRDEGDATLPGIGLPEQLGPCLRKPWPPQGN